MLGGQEQEQEDQLQEVAIAEHPVTDVPPSMLEVITRILGLAGPMLGSFTFSLEVFLTILLLPKLNATDPARAATTLDAAGMNTAFVFCMSPLFATAILLSAKVGELRELSRNHASIQGGELEEKKALISSMHANSLLIALGVSLPAFLSLFFADYLFTSVFRQKTAVVNDAKRFLEIEAIAALGVMARISIEQTMFALRKIWAAMGMGIFSLVVVGLPTALALGFGVDIGDIHIPRMGARGVAIGWVVESYLIAILFALYVMFSRELKQFGFFKRLA